MANITRHIPAFPRISRFDPFRDIEEMMSGSWMRPMLAERAAPSIRIDMTENDQAYTVYAEIPGVRKDDIKVSIEGNRVSISAEAKGEVEKKNGDKLIYQERYQGFESRSFTLDSEVDESRAQARYADGVLQLTLPKRAGGAGAKEIKIT